MLYNDRLPNADTRLYTKYNGGFSDESIDITDCFGTGKING